MALFHDPPHSLRAEEESHAEHRGGAQDLSPAGEGLLEAFFRQAQDGEAAEYAHQRNREGEHHEPQRREHDAADEQDGFGTSRQIRCPVGEGIRDRGVCRCFEAVVNRQLPFLARCGR